MTDTPHIPGAEIAEARLRIFADSLSDGEWTSALLKAYNPTGETSVSYEQAKAALVADLRREALAARIVPPPNTDLIKRLRTVSNMINMGEKIAWGSETMLMDEAADALAAFPAANVPPQVNEAVLWVSSKQMPNLVAGGYVAARTAPEGNFDMPLYASDQSRVERLETALRCMKGAFDTPIARRQIDTDFANEARELARQALGDRS